MENVQVVEGDTSIQITGHDIWWKQGADKALTIIDKLIGADITITTFDGETPITNFVIPVEHVPAVIRKLIAFSTTGNIAIAADEMRQKKS